MKFSAPDYTPPPKRRYLPYILGGGAAILITGVIIGSRLWYTGNLKAFSPSDNTEVLFRVEEGMSSEAIARKLEDNELIRNQLAFRLYLRFQGVSGDVQAGIYSFKASQSVQDITRQLISGEIAARLITITPGMRLGQVKSRLRQEGYSMDDIEAALADSYDYSILADKPPEATLEGYLFPDTYQFELDTPVVNIIDYILYTTDQKVTAEIRQGWASHGLNLHQGLTLASIVEKEDSVPDNQSQIAQVFLKRLGIGMKLEADPTFQYGADLLGVEPSVSVDSPYNTYLHLGLPPGPIANPGLDAITAVAHPASSDWLFFLHDTEGNVHFTDNEDKHKRNIEEFLR